MRHTIFGAALALLGTVVPAQTNVIPNGDFENGLTGWTRSGFAVRPRLEIGPTSRWNRSSCYAFGSALDQNHDVFAPGTSSATNHSVLTADISVSALPGTQASRLTVLYARRFVHGESLSISAGSTLRFRVAAVTSMPLPKGARLQFQFTSNSPLAEPVEIRLDNVSVIPTSTAPVVHAGIRGRFAVNRSPTLCWYQQSGAYIAIAGLAQTPGISIPNWTGKLELAPNSLAVLFTGFSAGWQAKALRVPNDPALIGKPLDTQIAVYNGTTNVAHISDLVRDAVNDPTR